MKKKLNPIMNWRETREGGRECDKKGVAMLEKKEGKLRERENERARKKNS